MKGEKFPTVHRASSSDYSMKEKIIYHNSSEKTHIIINIKHNRIQI